MRALYHFSAPAWDRLIYAVLLPLVHTCRRVVNQQLEKATVAPIREQLLRCLVQTVPAERLRVVQTKRLQLRNKPQAFFGIPTSATSPTNWRSAVDEMNKIALWELPTEKSNALLQCATVHARAPCTELLRL